MAPAAEARPSVFGQSARIAQSSFAVAADKLFTAPALEFVLGQMGEALEVARFAFLADELGEQVLAR